MSQQYSKPWSAHTAWHTRPLLQEGAGCSTKQLSAVAPQVEQNFCAIATHTSSHAMSQQAGSIVHTSPQQSGLLQPGLSRFAVKQLLVAVAHEACACARPAMASAAAVSRIVRSEMVRWMDMEGSGGIGALGSEGQGVVRMRALPELSPFRSLNGAPMIERPRIAAEE